MNPPAIGDEGRFWRDKSDNLIRNALVKGNKPPFSGDLPGDARRKDRRETGLPPVFRPLPDAGISADSTYLCSIAWRPTSMLEWLSFLFQIT